MNSGIPCEAVAITPGTTALSSVVGLYVGGAGNVAVKTEKGTTTTFANVPAGTILPGRFQQVLSTGTTATNIVAFKSS